MTGPKIFLRKGGSSEKIRTENAVHRYEYVAVRWRGNILEVERKVYGQNKWKQFVSSRVYIMSIWSQESVRRMRSCHST